MKDISVCLPVIRFTPLLVDVIASLIHQSKLPDQLLVIDQSADPSLKIKLQPYLDQFHPSVSILYISLSSRGLVLSKSLAASLSSEFKYIVFGEDDMLFVPSYLSIVFSMFEQHSEIQGLSGVVHEAPFTLPETIREYFFSRFRLLHDARKYFSRNSTNISLYYTPFLYGGGSAWRVSCFRSVSFNPNQNLHFTEDIFFSHLVNRKFGPNSTALLPKLKQMHISSTNKNQYTSHVFGARCFESFQFIFVFSNNVIELFLTSLVLFLSRFLEVILIAPFSKKPTLLYFLFLSPLLASLPFSLSRTSVSPSDFFNSNHIFSSSNNS